MTRHVAALVVAAGRGTRLARTPQDLPKQYRHVAGVPVLTHTLRAVLSCGRITKTAVVIHPDDHLHYAAAIAPLSESERARLLAPIEGGATRQVSVHNGLTALTADSPRPEQVLIHDAARPFTPSEVFAACLDALDGGATAALAALPVFDTLKRAETTEGGRLDTVDRTNLWAAQTPQGFAFDAILRAHERAAAEGRDDFTDDTGLAEWQGHPVTLTLGASDSFKITTQQDLVRAEDLLRLRRDRSAAPVPLPENSEENRSMASSSPQWSLAALAALPDVRVGQGYDVHAFEDGDAVILGGVSVPHDRKLKGHSDADVALHALTDAIFGALADGDIGSHFPPSDPQWKGAASDQFLVYALDRLRARGGLLAHADVTLICEAPKIGPVREALRASIARICEIPVGRVAVKATTSERLGFTGRKEGIACMAAATIRLPF
ncbi:2-C-methyl-D-erythritol 4-phosphate cytidylyltransferase [Roseibium aestuarii]|uniref:Bifunctional enzyme IspD/IspF n=1 Tax=Roseibium aestuarii TaxID=2600299 RepID=A0ABW4JSJ8_9HYPH|nr:2-C-methyl-D-erythritol 4-phosphate cytidylyltransferase [Roseibium aestuarii]